MQKIIVTTINQTLEEKITALIQSGALNTKSGSIEVHFDDNGNLRKIERHVVLLKS